MCTVRVQAAAANLTRRTHMNRVLVGAKPLAFGTSAHVAVWQEGASTMFPSSTGGCGSMRILADLVIALGLVLVGIGHDARASGRNMWRWFVSTLVAGSLGPLLCLFTPKAGK